MISEIENRRMLIFYKEPYHEWHFFITCHAYNMLFVRTNALIVTAKSTIKIILPILK